MQLYYVVEKLLIEVGGIEEANGRKSIRVFDIDTQTMQIIELVDFVVHNSVISEDYIKQNLDRYDNEELIKL